MLKGGSELRLSWNDCKNTVVSPLLLNKSKAQLRLTNCSSTCDNVDECRLLSPYCFPSDSSDSMMLKSFIPSVLNKQIREATFALLFKMDPCQTRIESQAGFIHLSFLGRLKMSSFEISNLNHNN